VIDGVSRASSCGRLAPEDVLQTHRHRALLRIRKTVRGIMATDIAAILRDLESCYDFTGKSVIHVGAGGGQLIGYAGKTRNVLGVDPDAVAVERLNAAIRERNLEDRFRVLQADVKSVSARADVVFFEFCLHEIVDPLTALRHAQTLAPEVLVVDPAVDSRWAWYLCETEKAQRGWSAVERFPLAFDRTFPGEQHFHDHAELLARIEVLGECVIRRAQEFRGRTDFTIDMPYRVVLLSQ
jgi:SAM-dependent methyltransferase